MIVYYDKSRVYIHPRLFPYDAAAADQKGYIDFTENPDLIESSLEDFLPICHTPAGQTFYAMLRWINGPLSLLQTCDSALRLPQPHQDNNSPLKLCTHGRLYILYRNLQLNSSPKHADWLCSSTMHLLSGIDPAFTQKEGVVGFTKTICLQTAISRGTWNEQGFEAATNDPGFGHHCMLSFWAYGNSEEVAFRNLERLFRNLWSALEQLSNTLRQADLRQKT